MTERRQGVRQKSLLSGRLYFNNNRNAVDCLIRDISSTGARLIFSDAVSTPDVVDLYIPHKEQTLRAQVHWRHGQEVGVEFVQPMAQGKETGEGDLAERVRRLEAEIAGLKRLLRKMKLEAGPEFDAA